LEYTLIQLLNEKNKLLKKMEKENLELIKENIELIRENNKFKSFYSTYYKNSKS